MYARWFMTQASTHIPVLPAETLAALAPRPGDVYADCTAGQGGHAALVGERIGPDGVVVLNDADPGNLADARRRVESLPRPPRVVAVHGNYADLPRRLVEFGLAADMVLADLGFASGQVQDPARGFSFQRDGPLDMRLDPAGPTTAADLVASLTERELAEILRDFGEEREARRIAQKIVREREHTPITTTSQFAALVRSVVAPRGAAKGQSIDPATRAFQALRIAVNDELGSLSSLLEAVARAAAQSRPAGEAPAPSSGSQAVRGRPTRPLWIAPAARVAVISFHSLEDRHVKHTFTDLTTRGLATPAAGEGRHARPITATEDEQRANARSRSAKLRAIRLGPG